MTGSHLEPELAHWRPARSLTSIALDIPILQKRSASPDLGARYGSYSVNVISPAGDFFLFLHVNRVPFRAALRNVAFHFFDHFDHFAVDFILDAQILEDHLCDFRF